MRTLSIKELAGANNDVFEGRMSVIRCMEVPSSEMIRDDIARIETPIVYIDNSCHVRILAFPAVFTPDFYYAWKDGELLISTSLVDIAERLGNATLSSTEMAKLVSKGYCAPGETPLNEVSRFEGYKWYGVEEDGTVHGERLPFERLSWESDDRCYEDFKGRIDKSIDFWIDRYRGRRMHVLLSGGVDSRLIFLSLLKRGLEFQAQSSMFVPVCSASMLEDAAAAKEICRIAGVAHNITKVDPDLLNESYVAPVVMEMPCCTHATVGFKVPVDAFAKPGDVIWTGQNMDALYNMGPTARLSWDRHAIAQLFKRWYLSEEFAKTLSDVRGVGGPFARSFSRLGVSVFKRGYHDPNMRLPANSADFLARFAAADDYIVLRPGKVTPEPNVPAISAYELKRRVFEDKIAYMRGGDAQSIAVVAHLNGAEAVFPYSSTCMLQYFNSYRLGRRDVLSPKRFVYRYVKELASEINPKLGAFGNPASFEMDGIKSVDLYEQARIHLNSRLYREMMKVAGMGPFSAQELEGRGALLRSSEVVRSYWLARLENRLSGVMSKLSRATERE